VPLVIISNGVSAGDGGEERLWEYFCDYPDCPNTAERVIGYVREIAGGFAVCLRHAAVLEGRIGRDLPRVSFGDFTRRHELDRSSSDADDDAKQSKHTEQADQRGDRP
jgi:hypothetical protein